MWIESRHGRSLVIAPCSLCCCADAALAAIESGIAAKAEAA
jgi:hypothetical protein